VLEPLSEVEALGYLMMSGVAADAARQINLIARGHPLALNMATSIVLSDARRTVEEAGHQVIEALSRSYIEAVPDPITRRALEASSVFRCVTEPLSTLLPDMPHVTPSNGSPHCHSSSLVVTAIIHDAVRTASRHSRARDPDAHRTYRRAAWRSFRTGCGSCMGRSNRGVTPLTSCI
jgi:hypothetical protein